MMFEKSKCIRKLSSENNSSVNEGSNEGNSVKRITLTFRYSRKKCKLDVTATAKNANVKLTGK